MSWTLRRAFVLVMALAGVGVLLYPAAATWFSDRAHAGVISGYVRSVTAMTPERTSRLLRVAEEYNRHLPTGPLLDPYTSSTSQAESAAGGSVWTYLHTLDVGPQGIIGLLAVPSIGVSLPIYHGTGADTLDRGIGHLYGTALPVGGSGTHSVLTGHSGIPGDTLFTHLHQVHLGDRFTVTVLDRTLTYEVDQIRTVLPAQTSSLVAVPGRDYITLVTCTPIGVNTHRLLVRGVRVNPPGAPGAQRDAVPGRPGAGFPWWVLEGLAALVVVVCGTAHLGGPSERAA